MKEKKRYIKTFACKNRAKEMERSKVKQRQSITD